MFATSRYFHRVMTLRLLLGVCACLIIGPMHLAHGEDWPQWRGANRDGLSTETGLLKQWPQAGPKLAKQIDGLGAGFSTPWLEQPRMLTTNTHVCI